MHAGPTLLSGCQAVLRMGSAGDAPCHMSVRYIIVKFFGPERSMDVFILILSVIARN